MKERILGKDLKVSAMGYGCMGLSHAYGAATERTEAVKLIRQVYDTGYTFFDTAECYIGTNPDGSISYNEELVGEALKDCRHNVQIATKFGVKHEGRELIVDSRPERIRSALEGSLKKLGTDYVDLYYQHRMDPKVPIEEVAGVMSELIKEGKILHWGISEADEENLRRAHAVCPVTCIQNRYSMMARWHENLFPVLEELGVGYVAFSPLANGILTDAYKAGDSFLADDYRSVMPQYQQEAYRENESLFMLLRNIASEKHATPAQISLAWMLSQKPYIVPIPGSRKKERIDENAGACEIELTSQEIADMNELLQHMNISDVFGGSKTK